MPLVGTPWRVGSRVTEHLLLTMDFSSVETPTDLQPTTCKRSLDESEVHSADHDRDNECKKARCSSPCSDKYFILSAADGSSLSSISPFLLGKAVKVQAGSVADIRKLRNGTILVQTKDTKQADALQRLKKVGDTSIKVEAHRTLNYSKGVVKCTDLMFSSSEEIVKELRSQGVVACKKHFGQIRSRRTSQH